ncbi:MAG TPA: NUDIX domain-containing protein, partial [Planctomycetaceae bacterium]|nr:NUDIX domain-containing protein [Planctomycetaceae bacterium]
MQEELFDIVDAEDRVIGQATRREVHARGLRHRAVHIFVFDPDGRLLVQTRSVHKDEDPLRYTSSASGHVDAGETYEQAARRELREELGLSERPFEFLVKLPASPETSNEHTVLYRTRCTPDELQIDDYEVAAVEFVPLNTIERWLRERPRQFSSPFQTLLMWYFERCGCSEAEGGT